MTDKEAELRELLYLAKQQIKDLERDKKYYSDGYHRFAEFIGDGELLEKYKAFAVAKRLGGEWN